MFLNFSVSRCKLVTITLEKSTVNNELKKNKNKKNKKKTQIFSHKYSICESQIFNRTCKPHIQENEIKLSITLPYVEGTNEKLRDIPRSHKTRSTLYTENTLSTFIDKNNVVFETDQSNCEVVYFEAFNSFMTEAVIIQKPVINGLVSV